MDLPRSRLNLACGSRLHAQLCLQKRRERIGERPAPSKQLVQIRFCYANLFAETALVIVFQIFLQPVNTSFLHFLLCRLRHVFDPFVVKSTTMGNTGHITELATTQYVVNNSALTAYCVDTGTQSDDTCCMSATTPSQRFAVLLRKHRLDRGFSQERLAERAGLHRNFISLIERGVNQPSIDTLFQIAHGLEIPPAELVREICEFND